MTVKHFAEFVNSPKKCVDLAFVLWKKTQKNEKLWPKRDLIWAGKYTEKNVNCNLNLD